MQIGIRELKAKLSEYVRLAHNGEQIEVTDHGIAVARLTPLPVYPAPIADSSWTLREATSVYEATSSPKTSGGKTSAPATKKQSYPSLLKEAQKLGGHRTPRETLVHALREYLDYKKRMEFIALFGTVDFDPSYDYKAGRKKR